MGVGSRTTADEDEEASGSDVGNLSAGGGAFLRDCVVKRERKTWLRRRECPRQQLHHEHRRRIMLRNALSMVVRVLLRVWKGSDGSGATGKLNGPILG
jgi:hypothetical protein